MQSVKAEKKNLDAKVKTCEFELNKLDMIVNTRKSRSLLVGPRNNALCLLLSLLTGMVIPWVIEMRFGNIHYAYSNAH